MLIDLKDSIEYFKEDCQKNLNIMHKSLNSIQSKNSIVKFIWALNSLNSLANIVSIEYFVNFFNQIEKFIKNLNIENIDKESILILKDILKYLNSLYQLFQCH